MIKNVYIVKKVFNYDFRSRALLERVIKSPHARYSNYLRDISLSCRSIARHCDCKLPVVYGAVSKCIWENTDTPTGVVLTECPPTLELETTWELLSIARSYVDLLVDPNPVLKFIADALTVAPQAAKLTLDIYNQFWGDNYQQVYNDSCIVERACCDKLSAKFPEIWVKYFLCKVSDSFIYADDVVNGILSAAWINEDTREEIEYSVQDFIVGYNI